MISAGMLLVGLGIEGLLGWPGALHARIGHPVTWLGRLIDLCEARLNAGGRRARLSGGALTVGICVVAAGLPAMLVQALLPGGIVGVMLGGLLVWPLVATRSLWDHVRAVATPLAAGDLAGAREAVSMIVGRDPQRLDGPGIARAAMESLAENASDGVVAPVFWGLIAGLPGIAIYKAINTLDSMIGHRSDRYEAFGKVAARLDDVVNWVPARLTGLLFAASAFSGAALRVMWRDARHHRSPNAGWPEGAMAGALGLRLSGPRAYDSGVVAEPWVNADGADPGAGDLMRALALYRRAMGLMGLALLALALI